MSRIAILGLGAMGSRMASRLIDAGHEVIVYNRNAQRAAPLVDRGARHEKSPARAAGGADVVISMVTDDEASRHVWLDPTEGAVRTLRSGTIAVESSTVTPTWARRLHTALSETGAEFIDAPVAGSRPQAEAGALIYLVGGPASTLDKVRPLLLAMGGAIHHVGEQVGAGMAMKLVVNTLFSVQVAALSEMLGVIERAGVPRGSAVELLNQMPITSPSLQVIGKLIAAGKYDPMFPIDLVEKDLRYVSRTAAELEAEAPLAASAHEVFARASRAGLGNHNIAGVAKQYLGT